MSREKRSKNSKIATFFFLWGETGLHIIHIDPKDCQFWWNEMMFCTREKWHHLKGSARSPSPYITPKIVQPFPPHPKNSLKKSLKTKSWDKFIQKLTQIASNSKTKYFNYIEWWFVKFFMRSIQSLQASVNIKKKVYFATSKLGAFVSLSWNHF